MASVQCYQSQFDEKRFHKIRHTVMGLNNAMGSRCGFEYGEVFQMAVPVGGIDLVGIVKGSKGSPAPVQLPGQPN
jgi:hypothetical protein